MNEINLNDHCIYKDILNNSLIMEINDDFSGYQNESNINKRELINLVKFIRQNIKFTKQEYNEAFRDKIHWD